MAFPLPAVTDSLVLLHAKVNLPFCYLLTFEHRRAAGRKWRHICKFSDSVCGVLQCSAPVISEYFGFIYVQNCNILWIGG